MRALVKEAMEQGALGVASSLSGPPGSWIDTDTLVAMCEVASRYGGIYSTHMRTEGRGVFESVAEAIEIGRRANVPVDIIHLKIAEHEMWGQMPELTATIAAARARGQDVQANVYPYRAGQNNLSSIIPPWAHEGGAQAMIAAAEGPGAAAAAGKRNQPRHRRHQLVQPLHGHRQLGRHAAGLALEPEVQAVRRQAHERSDRGHRQARHRRAFRAAGEQQRLRAHGLLPPLRGRHAVRVAAAVGVDRFGRHGGDRRKGRWPPAIRIPAISARFRACSAGTSATRRCSRWKRPSAR